MTTYELHHEKTGWGSIPGDTKVIVAHFDNAQLDMFEPELHERLSRIV